MPPFSKSNLLAYKLLSVVFTFLLLQGCACYDDSCSYEPGTVALWSDNNERLAVVITDYGDDTSTKDNSRSVATLDLGGTNLSHVYSLDSEQYLSYYSVLKNYMILTKDSSSSLGIRQYQRLDLSNLNLETLVTNDKTCTHYHVTPSLDGSVLAIIEVAGQENGFFVNNDPNYSRSHYQVYSSNADSNTGCHKLAMKVTLVNVDNNETITEFLNEQINLSYSVSRTNSMSLNLNVHWSNQGLIINTHSHDKTYTIFNTDGTTADYDFPQDCYPLVTSSSGVSQQNIEAKAFIILDNGIYSQNNTVELTDLSSKSEEDYSWQDHVPTVGQEICVL